MHAAHGREKYHLLIRMSGKKKGWVSPAQNFMYKKNVMAYYGKYHDNVIFFIFLIRLNCSIRPIAYVFKMGLSHNFNRGKGKIQKDCCHGFVMLLL